jgi:branched-chain amino acid transport system permease protein
VPGPAAPRRRAASLAWAGLGVLLLAALALPRFQSPYQQLTWTRFLVLALMAQGWNFIGGYTGFAAFGNVAFFGIGAYATGLAMLSGWRVSFFPALAFGACLAGASAALLGLAVLRLKGHYFAIATLGVAEALREIADSWDSLTSGSTGIDLPIREEESFFYYAALALVAAGLVLTRALSTSKVGFAWQAIREDEDAARTLGVHTTPYKVLAFALSAVFAAFAGGLTAYQNTHVTPSDFFKVEYTLQMIIACIIGGTGTVAGPVIGAAVYELLSNYVWSRFVELHPTVLGLLIILFVIFVPRGLAQVAKASWRIAKGERRFRWAALLSHVRASRVT